LARGKGVKKSIKINSANIVDIAPTILYTMGLSIPRQMDGGVLEEIFERNSDERNNKMGKI
jgi:predicted AlkP superfamily phosphohydrolase/phosphomutase